MMLFPMAVSGGVGSCKGVPRVLVRVKGSMYGGVST